MRKTTKKEHYVNNKEFLAAMTEYTKNVNRAKRNKQPKYIESIKKKRPRLLVVPAIIESDVFM